jgi:hypothetical protein
MGRVEGSGEQPFLPILVAPAQQDGENMCFSRPLREYRLPKKRRKLTVRLGMSDASCSLPRLTELTDYG